jgi:ABC-type multidrug transport system fused ATPase/permease subunit
VQSILVLLKFITLYKKRHFYIIQSVWILNSFVQSLNIYIYGFFLFLLGTEFGGVKKDFSFLGNNFLFLNNINFNSFYYVVAFIIVFAIFSNLLNFLLIKFSNFHFCRTAEHVQYLLLKKYVEMDYQSFLNLGLDKKSSIILMDSQKLYNVLMSFGTFFYNILNLGIIFSILIFVNFQITLFAFLFIGGMYLIFSQLVNKKLKYNSDIFSTLGTKKINLINTCLSGLRELKIYNMIEFNLDKFKQLTSEVAKSKASTATLSVAPRYFIETFFFICIGALVFSINHLNYIEKSLFVYLLILIISFSRLIPSFQNLFGFYSILQDSDISFKKIHEELIHNSYDKLTKLNNTEEIKKIKIIPNSLEFKNVYFKYALNKKYIVKNLSIKFLKGDKIFIRGETGSGKSTFLDIVSGLLKISKGRILINKENNFKSLKDILNLSYVSQFPFLYNLSILENITLKKNVEKKDLVLIYKIIKILELNDLVKNINDLNKNIGDFGNKISGGQKQRLCIARALFLNPEILILDESLNAVDQKKRKIILKNIINVYKKMILFYVSHDKLDSVFFKKLILFEKNKIISTHK